LTNENQVHHCTDPRDCVFALLSHPSATIDGSLIIEPNYSITTARVYTNVALNLIERTKSLQILAFVDHHEEPSPLNIPTWVPDWHAVNVVAPLRCPTNAASETDASISITQTDKGISLKCRGVLIDTLQAMSDTMSPNELTITTLQKEKEKKLPFLIDHIWTKTVVEQPGITRPSLKYFIASLSLVLTGGYLGYSHSESVEEQKTAGEETEQQISDLAALILGYDHIREEGHSEGLFASLPPAEKILLQIMAAKSSAHRFVQDMTWASMCRRVFRTKEGYIGLGPITMREGDMCVVLWGSVYPMIVRDYDGSFQLVGPALVYDFMDGEAGKMCEAGTLIEREFEIL